MFIHDAADTTSRETTAEGFLRVKARIARVGIHTYRASELGAVDGFAPEDTVRVYRPPDAVFDPASMASFAGKPVTDDHPPTMVDARNWKRYAIGHAGQSVTRDGEHLVAELLITDADAVARAEAGAQLSNGYHADFAFEAGATPDGAPYDAVQGNIRGNHIALVSASRCGESCRIGDASAADCGCAPAAPVSVTVDGIAIETTTAAGATALERLRLAVEAKDGTIAALAAQLSDEDALETRVNERTAVIDGARSVFGQSFEPKTRSTAEIRRAVVAHLMSGDLGPRSDAYVAAAFDTLVATRPAVNPLATHFAATGRDGGGDREAARRTRDRFLTHAWKGDQSHGVR